MTTDACIINGTFADLKSVKTRSVVQMVVEVPIEQASQIVAAFGYPQPGNEIAVTVVRFNPDKADPDEGLPSAAEVKGILKPDKPKKRFEDYPLSQQAGIRCGDGEFQHWLGVSTTGEAAEKVRRICCDVSTRAALDTDAGAAREWGNLNAEYEQWAGLAAEDRS